MAIVIVHLKRSAFVLSESQVFDLSRSSKYYKLLGNDYTHLPLNKTKAKHQVNTVEEAVQCYKENLYSVVIQERLLNNKPYTDLLFNLYDNFKKLNSEDKDMYLGCWCKDELIPKHYDHSCHCDVIKNILIKKWNKENGSN